MKTFSEYIREAVDFRLGGKQQKGFDQTKVKTFRELVEGDKFYYWSVSEDTVIELALYKKPYIKSDELRLEYYDYVDGAYYYAYAKDIDNTYSCSGVGAWVVTTSFEEMCRIAKEEFNTILDDKNLKECYAKVF